MGFYILSLWLQSLLSLYFEYAYFRLSDWPIFSNSWSVHSPTRCVACLSLMVGHFLMWFVIFYCELISGASGAFLSFPFPAEVPSALGWREILREPSFYFASSRAPRVPLIPKPVFHQLNGLGFPHCEGTINSVFTPSSGRRLRPQFLMGNFIPPT